MACRYGADVRPESVSLFPGSTGCLHGNCRLIEAYTPTFLHLQDDRFPVDLDDAPVHSAYRHHIVALFYFLDKLPLVLGLLLLRPDHEKVEHENDAAKKEQLCPLASGLRL